MTNSIPKSVAALAVCGSIAFLSFSASEIYFIVQDYLDRRGDAVVESTPFLAVEEDGTLTATHWSETDGRYVTWELQTGTPR